METGLILSTCWMSEQKIIATIKQWTDLWGAKKCLHDKGKYAIVDT